MKRRRKKIFRSVAFAFAVAAFTASAAQAKPVSTAVSEQSASSAAASYTPQQMRALELRSQGMNVRYGTTAVSSTPQQLQEQLRFQGVDKQRGLIGKTTTSEPSSSTPVLASSSNGFSWGDGFAGAGAVVATAIILVAGVMSTRRRAEPLGV